MGTRGAATVIGDSPKRLMAALVSIAAPVTMLAPRSDAAVGFEDTCPVDVCFPPDGPIGNRVPFIESPEYFQMILNEWATWQDVQVMAALAALMQLAPEEQLAANGDPRRDVRCHPSGSVRETTSRSPQEARWIAAESLYKLFFQSLNQLNRLRLNPGVVFRVTYADGGKESWLVVNPIPSAISPSLADQPLPPSGNSGAPGDGVPKSGPVCPNPVG